MFEYYLATYAQSVPSIPVSLFFAAPPVSWLGDLPDTFYENCFVCAVLFTFIFQCFHGSNCFFTCFKRLNQFWLLYLDENEKALIIHVFLSFLELIQALLYSQMIMISIKMLTRPVLIETNVHNTFSFFVLKKKKVHV